MNLLEAFPGQGGKKYDSPTPETALLNESLENHQTLAELIQKRLGIDFKGVFGNSFGLYAALVVTGVVTVVAARELARRRAEIVKKTEENSDNPTAMASIIGLDEGGVKQILAKYNVSIGEQNLVRNKSQPPIPSLEITNYNGSTLFVIGGSAEQIALVGTELGERRFRKLETIGTYHHPCRTNDSATYAKHLGDFAFQEPKISLISSTRPRLLTRIEDILEELHQQMVRPVRLPEVAGLAASLGFNTLIDGGPGNTLQKIFQRLNGQLRIFSWEGDKSKIEGLVKGGDPQKEVS